MSSGLEVAERTGLEPATSGVTEIISAFHSFASWAVIRAY